MRKLWADPRKRFGIIYLTSIVLGMTVITFNGYYADYLIAPDWSMYVRPIGWLVALTSAGWAYYSAAKINRDDPMSFMPKTWGEVIPFMMISAFFSFYTLVGFPPLISALLLRQPVQIAYTVASVGNDAGYGQHQYRRRCYSTINFEHLPALVGMICFAPSGVHSNAKPGDTIVLSGWGSALGVFYDRVELIKKP